MAQMLHYYLQRGITPEHILSLDMVSRLYYYASMELEIERTRKAMQAGR